MWGALRAAALGASLTASAGLSADRALAQAALADGPTYSILDFADLDGWADDDHAAALDVFLTKLRFALGNILHVRRSRATRLLSSLAIRSGGLGRPRARL